MRSRPSIRHASCIALLLTLAAVAPAAAAQSSSRLPGGVRPRHYDVTVDPDAHGRTFHGSTVVTFDLLRPSRTLTLDALGLRFRRAELLLPGGHRLAVTSVAVDEKAQTATFTFPRSLRAATYRLALEYEGAIQTQSVGLFRLDYPTATGEASALFTQLESTDARRVFPCWDEPAYKATFQLEAVVPAGQIGISNTPIASTSPLPDGRSRVRFAVTPRMSTYLLFLAIGDLQRITTRAQGVELGVVAQRGHVEQGRFALEQAARVLADYEHYFGSDFPLPKLDNVAAPGRSQFFSAMENWGAIFTFESSLLLEPAMSSDTDRQRVFAVLAHEMAHQWFGDLVTMAWWNDIWLNEGFASWMASREVARAHPEWHQELDDVSGRDRTLSRDALSTTHPIVQPVETVDQAFQAFDGISYGKGRAVLAMLEEYVGPEAWQRGIRRYLGAHAYGNATTDDLWRAVQAESRLPVVDVAHDFTMQPGVPLLRVDSTCRDGRTELVLRQDELHRDESHAPARAWRVPVVVRSLDGATARTLVRGGRGVVTLAGCAPVVVNAGQAGYFRTLYAPPMMQALVAAYGRLAPADQLGVLTDEWELGLDGLVPPTEALDLVRQLPADADPALWSQVADIFEELDRDAKGLPMQAPLRAFAIGRLAPVLARLGWQPRAGERDVDATLRTRLVEVLSALDDEATIAEARREHALLEANPEAVASSMRQVILEAVARHADAASWEALLARARAEKSALVRQRLYLDLAAPEDEALARRALALAITDEPGATISASMMSVVARLHPDLAFDFAVAHLDRVEQLVDESSRTRYFPRLESGSVAPDAAAKLESFAAAHLDPTSRRPVASTISGIRFRERVRRERLPAIARWLGQPRDEPGENRQR